MDDLTFGRELYKIVRKYKDEHPGVLEARTAQRRKEQEHDRTGKAASQTA